MNIYESILDDETLVRTDLDNVSKLSANDTLSFDELPMRMFFRVGYHHTQIINGELDKNVHSFLDRLDDVLMHCRFMTQYKTQIEVLVIEGANFIKERFMFPIDDVSV